MPNKRGKRGRDENAEKAFATLRLVLDTFTQG
jgi:hypothetical protein